MTADPEKHQAVPAGVSDPSGVLAKVSRALGRNHLPDRPTPPAIDEPITRLVHSDIGLAELFTKTAAANKIEVVSIAPAQLGNSLAAFLKVQHCQRIGITSSPFIERLNLARALELAGFTVSSWDQMTRDQSYDVDCGITDVAYAIAETGSLVIRPTPGHGRSLSLAPALHIAIIEQRNLIADLVDLFNMLPRDGSGTATIISGPSKTADIEGNLVVGVHGPHEVRAYLLT
jgi:L-lactate dehydrogenase complex protein LldG